MNRRKVATIVLGVGALLIAGLVAAYRHRSSEPSIGFVSGMTLVAWTNYPGGLLSGDVSRTRTYTSHVELTEIERQADKELRQADGWKKLDYRSKGAPGIVYTWTPPGTERPAVAKWYPGVISVSIDAVRAVPRRPGKEIPMSEGGDWTTVSIRQSFPQPWSLDAKLGHWLHPHPTGSNEPIELFPGSANLLHG